MAIFGRKKDEENNPEPVPGVPAPSKSDAKVVFSPEKAAKFFDHARTVQETGNYEYAMQLWLSGLRFDPSNMNGLEGFFAVTPKYLNDPSSKKGLSKEVQKAADGKDDVSRFLTGILDWALKPKDPPLAVRAFEASAKAGLVEPGFWIGERAFATALNTPKPRKDLIVKCVEAFRIIGAYDKSVLAAEQALKLDPTDGQLSAYIRSLAAQATMAKGGYEQSGQAGGFRRNIRDADKQRMLDESERLSKTDETVDRLLASAEEEYKKRPDDLPTIDKYAKYLLERGRPQEEERAHKLYTDAFTATKQFRFREQAGEIRLRQSRRKVSELAQMLAKSPEHADLKRMHAQAASEHAHLDLEEYKLRVEAYPTDITRKFELGKRHFALGQFNEAIALFQESQGDPKNRAASLCFLGQSFLNIHWNDESIETFRGGLELREITPDMQLEMRYWMMVALQNKALEARDLPSVEEADRIASSIAVQQISYRDIRARRESIKKLLGELRAAKG